MDDSIGVGLGILYSESSVTLIQTLLSLQHKLYLIFSSRIPGLVWHNVICSVWQLFEGVCNLLDRLGAWPHLANSIADLREMAQIGLRLVLGYILLEDPQVSVRVGSGGVEL